MPWVGQTRLNCMNPVEPGSPGCSPFRRHDRLLHGFDHSQTPATFPGDVINTSPDASTALRAGTHAGRCTCGNCYLHRTTTPFAGLGPSGPRHAIRAIHDARAERVAKKIRTPHRQ